MEKENKFVVRNTPIYVLADNIISSLGFDTASNIEQIHAEKSQMARHDDVQVYPTPFWASRVDATVLEQKITTLEKPQNYSKLEQLFLLSINEILSNAIIDITKANTLINFCFNQRKYRLTGA